MFGTGAALSAVCCAQKLSLAIRWSRIHKLRNTDGETGFLCSTPTPFDVFSYRLFSPPHCTEKTPQSILFRATSSPYIPVDAASERKQSRQGWSTFGNHSQHMETAFCSKQGQFPQQVENGLHLPVVSLRFASLAILFLNSRQELCASCSV